LHDCENSDSAVHLQILTLKFLLEQAPLLPKTTLGKIKIDYEVACAKTANQCLCDKPLHPKHKFSHSKIATLKSCIMARCSRFSPIPPNMELQHTLLLTPDATASERDPRKVASWNFNRDDSILPRPFPNRPKSEMALPLHRFSHATPDSPEMLYTPERPFPKYQPAKLDFSPFSQNGQDASNPIYDMNHPTRQSLWEKPRLITSIDVIYCSSIIQENIHHLMADHALDKTKTQQTVRYLGLAEATFFEYLRETYPRHYWTHLGDKC